jgi:hypothetical protein
MSMMRVLVAFEDLRSLYRELLVRAILDSRPTLNVRSASLEELADVLLGFDPHVVVCSEPNDDHPQAVALGYKSPPTTTQAKTTTGLRSCVWTGSSG